MFDWTTVERIGPFHFPYRINRHPDTENQTQLKLKAAGIDYKSMAGFGLIGLPFSAKIIPAIFCDSVSIGNIGRRKSWILIGQFLMG